MDFNRQSGKTCYNRGNRTRRGSIDSPLPLVYHYVQTTRRRSKHMKYTSTVLAVSDIHAAREFYETLFGLEA